MIADKQCKLVMRKIIQNVDFMPNAADDTVVWLCE